MGPWSWPLPFPFDAKTQSMSHISDFCQRHQTRSIVTTPTLGNMQSMIASDVNVTHD
jgi:hypothetical protein